MITPTVLATKSGIVYDIESLGMESRARALAGLTSQFDVVYCREISPVYEFQLIERPQIRIRDQGAECTCSEYENHPDMACRHIFVSSTFATLPLYGVKAKTHGFTSRRGDYEIG